MSTRPKGNIASGSAAELETQLLLAEQECGVPVTPLLVELGILERMLESIIQKL